MTISDLLPAGLEICLNSSLKNFLTVTPGTEDNNDHHNSERAQGDNSFFSGKAQPLTDKEITMLLSQNNKYNWIDYSDRRDDRFLLFCSSDKDTRTFFYTVRAVTKGIFALPPVSSLNQYDENISSINGSRTVTIR